MWVDVLRFCLRWISCAPESTPARWYTIYGASRQRYELTGPSKKSNMLFGADEQSKELR